MLNPEENISIFRSLIKNMRVNEVKLSTLSLLVVSGNFSPLILLSGNAHGL
jgi:hypothetical protein